MPETYCGKNCADCAYKERLACPGCQTVLKLGDAAPCRLAACCLERGHESCATCQFQSSCSVLARSDERPARLLRKRRRAAARQATLFRNAPFLQRWLWVLFWLYLFSVLVRFLDNRLPAGTPAAVAIYMLNLIVPVIYGTVLLVLSQKITLYRTAGILLLIGGGCSVATALIPEVFRLPVSLIQCVIVLVGLYLEYKAHTALARAFDSTLAECWQHLWRTTVCAYCILFVCTLVVHFFPSMEILAAALPSAPPAAVIALVFELALVAGSAIASLICFVLIDIRKLLYLYRMVKFFRMAVRSSLSRDKASFKNSSD